MIFDTAGFLAGLEGLFERVYTTPLVLSEVKDSHSR
ncbi:MAG: DNA-binding protein, partial [Sulfolobaceae archaeon]